MENDPVDQAAAQNPDPSTPAQDVVDEVHEQQAENTPTRPTDQEVEDRRQAELDAERQEHNSRRISSDVPTSVPTETQHTPGPVSPPSES